MISLTGLDITATNALQAYLQQLSLPTGFNGEIVFKFPVQKGRVKRIMLDETSTLKEATVIEIIKRSLLAWQVPPSLISIIHLTLRIQS